MWIRGLYRKLFVWRLRYISNRNFVFILSGIVGIIAGLAAVLLKNSVHWLNHIVTGGFQVKTGNYYYVILPTIGLLLTYIAAHFLFKEKLGHGVTSVLYAISKGSSKMKRRMTFTRIITSTLTVGFGGSVGLEAPIVVTGSAIGSNAGRETHLHYRHRTLMIGCGAAAAVSAIFDSPIAGVIFAIEVILTDVRINKFVPLLIASVSGSIVSMLLTGKETLFHFTLKDPFKAIDVPYYIGLGIFCGIFAVYFTRTHYYIESKIQQVKNAWMRILIAGIGLGIIVFFFPPIFGEGYITIKKLIADDGQSILNRSIFSDQVSNEWFVVAFVASLILIKAVASSLTIGSGGSGGIFAPSLFIGGLTGFMFARIVNITSVGTVSTSNFALVGMCGMMSGVLHAPLTGIFLIAEITEGYTLFVPLMIVSAIAYITVYYFEPHSIYTKHLIESGDLIHDNKDKEVLSLLDIRKMILHDFKTVHPDSTLGELVSVIKNSTRNTFPIVNSECQLVGLVALDDIRQVMFDEEKYRKILVKTLMTEPKTTIYVNESMDSVMAKFEKTNDWYIPVINGECYIGFISKSNIFNAYRQRLKKQAIED